MPGITWGGLGREEDEEEWRSSVGSEEEEQLSRWNWVGRGLGAGALPRVITERPTEKADLLPPGKIQSLALAGDLVSSF